eukprot:SAG31_NODE_31310_length_369_cov_1.344444_1_plen_62_part_10
MAAAMWIRGTHRQQMVVGRPATKACAAMPGAIHPEGLVLARQGLRALQLRRKLETFSICLRG